MHINIAAGDYNKNIVGNKINYKTGQLKLCSERNKQMTRRFRNGEMYEPPCYNGTPYRLRTYLLANIAIKMPYSTYLNSADMLRY